MKKKVFFGTLAAMIFSIHISAFAAPTAAFGDVSAGNHIAAPYAKSDIIVPRPSASKYAALQKYAYIGIPADVKGHWAEKYLTYFLQTGCMDGSAAAFHPNEPITYADFAAVVARLGLKPVEFNGGTVSHKVFRDAALWNTAYPDAQAALICGEAGVWGNPSEANHTMLGYPGFCLQDQAQRQYIAYFLVSMLPMQEKEKGSEQQFTDETYFQSALCKDAMKRLADENIISCYADGTIRPEGAVTKAELAAMLYKVMEKSQFDRNIVSDNLYGKYHSYYWDEEEKLLDLVNDARRKAGVSELKYDADLNALCEVKMLEKSIYGLDTFTKQIQYDGKTIEDGHVSRFYGRCTAMARAFGLTDYYVGENAVLHAPYAAKAHNRLADSEAHRKNYLNPMYEVAGFAVGEKATYQMFAYVK